MFIEIGFEEGFVKRGFQRIDGNRRADVQGY